MSATLAKIAGKMQEALRGVGERLLALAANHPVR
jgi:hypothetical protein